jgi:hypothetical protein
LSLKAVDAVVEINASAEDVWEVLTDFDAYYQWNPYLKRVKGKLALDESLDITFKVGEQERRIRGHVALLFPGVEMRFTANLGTLGSLKMEHAFHIETFEDRDVCFVQRQTYSGFLATDKKIAEVAAPTKKALEAMNAALKERVESKVGAGITLR